MKKTLRILVLTEIALGVGSVVVDWYMQRFLPDALQAFLKQTEESDLTAFEWVLLPIGLGLIVLMIVAWTAVWRLSPRARLLYTLAWTAALPLTAIWGPYVRSGVAVALEAGTAVTAGMILGILWFANGLVALAATPSNLPLQPPSGVGQSAE